MPILEGQVKTEKAEKYLIQMCKHFAHKVEASYGDNRGRVEFMYGPAQFSAEDETLHVRFELKSKEYREGAKSVIDSHLERFAFREAIKGLEWRDS